ncbi:MAG: MCE family protein, partial [Mycobacteriales bacterium]
MLVPTPRLGLRLRRTGLQALGLAFLAVLTGLIGLSIAFYNHAFTTTVPATLEITNIGDQLTPPADVKLRGILVGQVTAVHSAGSGASMTLALNPADLALIPSNVLARILPKTLFGQKFVDLVIPGTPSPVHLAANAVIPEDRSVAAVEAETVFNRLLPLLRQVNPAELNATLSAISTALAGQAQALGQNLVTADAYFARFNPHLATVDADISGLADLASNLANATPNLLTTLSNFSVNANTLVAKQDTLAQFLAATMGFANTATAVLTRNAADLITLAAVS